MSFTVRQGIDPTVYYSLGNAALTADNYLEKATLWTGAPIWLYRTTTVNAIAVNADGTLSEPIRRNITVRRNAPVFSYDASAKTLTITSAEGTLLKYAVDGVGHTADSNTVTLTGVDADTHVQAYTFLDGEAWLADGEWSRFDGPAQRTNAAAAATYDYVAVKSTDDLYTDGQHRYVVGLGSDSKTYIFGVTTAPWTGTSSNGATVRMNDMTLTVSGDDNRRKYEAWMVQGEISQGNYSGYALDYLYSGEYNWGTLTPNSEADNGLKLEDEPKVRTKLDITFTSAGYADIKFPDGRLLRFDITDNTFKLVAANNTANTMAPILFRRGINEGGGTEEPDPTPEPTPDPVGPATVIPLLTPVNDGIDRWKLTFDISDPEAIVEWILYTADEELLAADDTKSFIIPGHATDTEFFLDVEVLDSELNEISETFIVGNEYRHVASVADLAIGRAAAAETVVIDNYFTVTHNASVTGQGEDIFAIDVNDNGIMLYKPVSNLSVDDETAYQNYAAGTTFNGAIGTLDTTPSGTPRLTLHDLSKQLMAVDDELPAAEPSLTTVRQLSTADNARLVQLRHVALTDVDNQYDFYQYEGNDLGSSTLDDTSVTLYLRHDQIDGKPQDITKKYYDITGVAYSRDNSRIIYPISFTELDHLYLEPPTIVYENAEQTLYYVMFEHPMLYGDNEHVQIYYYLTDSKGTRASGFDLTTATRWDGDIIEGLIDEGEPMIMHAVAVLDSRLPAAVDYPDAVTIPENEALEWANGDQVSGRFPISPETLMDLADGTTTGITAVEVTDEAPTEWYDLMGRRIAEPTTGFAIRRQGRHATKVIR